MNRFWNLYFIFTSSIIAIVSFLLLRNRLLLFIKQKDLVVENYAGRKVLNCGGLLFLLPILLANIPFILLNPTTIQILFVLMIPVLTFTGFVDDILGDSTSKGLTGHTDMLRKGSFSTGFLKAIIGGIMGFLLALVRNNNLLIFLLDIFVFALSVNSINLLDLRPGRAIKGFIFLLLVTIIISGFIEIQIILPTIILLLLYTGGELKEIYMLGDAGANLLGGILGFYSVMVLQQVPKMFLFILLLFMHLFSEFDSISEFIERIPWLKWLDMLGRERKRS